MRNLRICTYNLYRIENRHEKNYNLYVLSQKNLSKLSKNRRKMKYYMKIEGIDGELSFVRLVLCPILGFKMNTNRLIIA